MHKELAFPAKSKSTVCILHKEIHNLRKINRFFNPYYIKSIENKKKKRSIFKYYLYFLYLSDFSPVSYQIFI